MLTKLVESLGGDIDHLNSIVNNKIEAAGKQIRDDITGQRSVLLTTRFKMLKTKLKKRF